MNVASAISSFRAGAPLFSLLKLVKGVFVNKSNADDLYRELMPVLSDYLTMGRRFNDPQVQHIVNVLRELPAYGTRRRNFERFYLKDEYGLRKLPMDPSEIPYGYWH